MAGCQLGNRITYMNLAEMYEPEKKLAIDGIRIFNENDSISKVFVLYNLSYLLYEKPLKSKFFEANYSFSYSLFSSYESNEVIDSATFFLSDSLNFRKNIQLLFDFEVNAASHADYLLEIEFNDLNRNTSYLIPKNVNKTSFSSPQNFLPVDKNDQVIFTDWFGKNEQIRILCKDKMLDTLYVRFYRREFPIAIPPYSLKPTPSYEYAADDIFSMQVSDGVSEILEYPEKGFFHFQSEPSVQDGLTLFQFAADYPEITDPKQLVPPLRYLTTNTEFKKLIHAPDPKAAVDSFWIETAGNEERAVELIRDYYSRVEDANWYFTSFKEGWKTDRGMTYIVMGKPQTVFRSGEIETWIYGEQGNRVSLTFDFVKAVNPFTDNDYILRRRPEFKSPWFIAVDYWRR